MNCGWGGEMISACALNIPFFTGIDINENLRIPYAGMLEVVRQHSTTQCQMIIQDALTVDYEALQPRYDFVFTSPPYFNIERYSHNTRYGSNAEMTSQYYIPLFTKTYASLLPGGRYCLSIPKNIYYSICVPLWGEAKEFILVKRNKKQNDYEEFIYVWEKEKEEEDI